MDEWMNGICVHEDTLVLYHIYIKDKFCITNKYYITTYKNNV